MNLDKRRQRKGAAESKGDRKLRMNKELKEEFDKGQVKRLGVEEVVDSWLKSQMGLGTR